MSLTRRRFLTISAASLMAGPAGAGVNRQSFLALGARCSLTLPGPEKLAKQAFREVRKDIGRVERAFSLHDDGSELSRINRDGFLPLPGPVFREGTAVALQAARRSGGSFDVTVQPIWDALAAGRDPDFSMVGWRSLKLTDSNARFLRPGMAATFNGIAQGYAADRAATVLRAMGYRDLLVNLGEYLGVGRRPDGDPWRIGVAHPATEKIVTSLELEAEAPSVATSAPRGTLIRGHPHIFDPLQRDGPRWASVTVRAETAAMADAFSTAIAAAPRDVAEELLRNSPAREAILIPQEGDPIRWQG